jgi:hypothetical protein
MTQSGRRERRCLSELHSLGGEEDYTINMSGCDFRRESVQYRGDDARARRQLLSLLQDIDVFSYAMRQLAYVFLNPHKIAFAARDHSALS